MLSKDSKSETTSFEGRINAVDVVQYLLRLSLGHGVYFHLTFINFWLNICNSTQAIPNFLWKSWWHASLVCII